VSDNRYCATRNNGSVKPYSSIGDFVDLRDKLNRVRDNLATIASNRLSVIIIYMAKQSSKSSKRTPKSSELTEKCLTFREATRLALDLYHETIRDLARYDREAKPLDTISY
jgi:hypothetical protein